jgi:dihydroflavonol-4-reductase
MRALVTGASGFLGFHLAQQLHAAGVELRLTYAPGDPAAHLDEVPAERAPCDLGDERALRRLCDGVEAVFHVAGLVTFAPWRRAAQWRVNVEGTRALLAAARAAGVRRFVYTSTVNTVGIPRPGRLGDEETPFDWARYHIGYMDSKHAAQALVQAAAPAVGAVSVLPGTMFGPHDVNLNGAGYVALVARSPLVVPPPGGTCVVHVADVARGHLLALERGRVGARYILGGDPVSYRELLGWIAADLGRRAPLPAPPAALWRGAGRLADRLGRVWGLLALEGLAVALSSELYYSSARAERELGWTHRPARAAVREAAGWYAALRP